MNGRFLAKPPTGVTLVGREFMRAILEELDGSDLKLRVALPAGGDLAPEAALVATAPEAVALKGWAGNLGEQILMPLHYSSACILNFCNSAPLLANRAIVWIHDTHIFDVPDSYARPYRLWHKSIFAAAKARRFDIVTVSHASRSKLIALGAHPDRVHVIYNGGDHLQRFQPDPGVSARLNLDGAPFVLMVGSKARHKNIPFAVETLLQSLIGDVRIVLVGLGQVGPYGVGAETADNPRIVRAPRLNESELRALYQSAACVVTPSLLEGFGLPAAEALWENAPQVLSNRGALPEVGGEAALYFDPLNAEQLATQVQRALGPGEAAKLRASAEIQKQKFTWRRAARETIDLFLRT